MRFLIAVLCVQTSLFGQKVLYNDGQAKQGQATAAAAKKIASDTLTAQEMQNLAGIEKQQIDGELAAAQVTMRKEVEALSTWKTVSDLATRIRAAINDPLLGVGAIDTTDLAKRQAEITKEQNDLATRIGQLKQSSKQQQAFSLNPVIDRLGDVKGLTDFAAQVDPKNQEASKALQQVIDGLKELNQLVDTARTIWQSAKDVAVNPGTLAPSAQETQKALLAVEAQYLKELALIRARRMLDYGELRAILETLEKQIADSKVAPDRQIREDLSALVADGRAAAAAPAGSIARGTRTVTYDEIRIEMKNRLAILYLAGSVSAQNMAARDIAGLRETLAWRRSKLRSDAVYNGTYEKTIELASDRLAAYYGAGFKPSQIAQLLHDIAAAVSLPKIAF